MNPVKLSIVIVSWNVEEFLDTCLRSVLANIGNLSTEVIVVDNASKDNTVKMVKNKFPQVKLVTNDSNEGFAAANNQGILQSHGEYILALNPDTKIPRDTFQKMVAFMDRKPKVGIVGCQHRNPDFTLQPSVRSFPTWTALTFLFTKFGKLFPGSPPIWKYLRRDLDYNLNQPVDQVAGSCFMMRRAMINEIGLFDENFFIWFEEVDMCKRAQLEGWAVWYFADSDIIHYGGQSFRQQLVVKNQKDFFRSAVYYMVKNGSG